MRSELEELIGRHETQMKDWKQKAADEDARQHKQRAQLEAEVTKCRSFLFWRGKNMLCRRLKSMEEDLLKTERHLAAEKEQHEREWIKIKDAMEKETTAASEAREAVQEERLELQEKQHHLEIERREIHALKLKLESDAAAHLQVSYSEPPF